MVHISSLHDWTDPIKEKTLGLQLPTRHSERPSVAFIQGAGSYIPGYDIVLLVYGLKREGPFMFTGENVPALSSVCFSVIHHVNDTFFCHVLPSAFIVVWFPVSQSLGLTADKTTAHTHTDILQHIG